MIGIVVRRLVWLAALIVIITALTYTLFFVIPGDPAVQALPRGASPQTIAEVRHRMALDQPLWVQYLYFFHGPDLIGTGHASGILNWPPNLGYSFKNQQPVLDTILDRLPVTISLAIGGVVLWLLVGLAVGIISALRPRSVRDRTAMIFALIGVSMPQFLLGIALLYFFYFQIPIFPAPTYVAFTQDPLSWAWHLVLPWCTLALTYAAAYSRILRSSMLEVANESWVLLARAKGLPRRDVVWRHVVRPALSPVMTMLGMDIGILISGAVVVEIVFGLNGLGNLAIHALTTVDLPVIAGTVLVAAVSVAVANLVVDVGYRVLDARVQ
ncbi:MAG TPA: ABC transporter permease [Candidatus Dormibacteraeota bacterium]